MEKNLFDNQYIGESFEEMSIEEMENIFGGTAENIEARSISVISVVSAAAVTSFVGSYLVTAVFCKE